MVYFGGGSGTVLMTQVQRSVYSDHFSRGRWGGGCTVWHEILAGVNFVDSLLLLFPQDWQILI